jgi:quercetin dioxygenase-like cupin family protein
MFEKNVSPILTLIGSIKTAFAQSKVENEAVSLEINKVLALLEPLPPLTGGFPKRINQVTRHIENSKPAGSIYTKHLLDEIYPVIESLPWSYSYPKRKDSPELDQNIAFAEIIGPVAPFRSDSVCLGLTLIGPGTLYPAHHHPATELYFVLAGTAKWELDEVSNDKAPGSFILHPSQAVHAMQTYSESLLAIYTWSGPDVRTTSVYTNSISNYSAGQILLNKTGGKFNNVKST